MKLISFVEKEQYKLGVVTEQGVLDVGASVKAIGADRVAQLGNVPLTVTELLEGGAASVAALQQLMETVTDPGVLVWRDESSLKYGPCVTHPNKIICIGLNYRKHAEETKAEVPTHPILFNKFNNALTGHLCDIPLPESVSRNVDYEAELAIVIGKQAKRVAKEQALDYVFGYCNGNDLSARDLQRRTSQWLLGKSIDSFCPLGPYLVTADEVGDPNALDIRCTVNGQVRQHSNTSDMVFPCDELVSYISQHMTLVPGDIILTGTPSGVVMGLPKEQRVFLQPGDIVTVEIEKLGALTNQMVSE
ncbi:MAG: fumarylacetoacetate hydrolase family protein [Candidatus Cohnella colombiensis]|uniref:Fumarylacetoacetate hydrolase family protein n=1 Tax=Candidatus Cohnella colombiensis TaxID=3121368 RepID=A0AA95EVV2_9BACL|nr:MAG: fumarylacetoacetate hydrolase family protein [Cohnella sp.]